MKHITESFETVNQSLQAERVIVLEDGTRLRARIRRNAYDSQSYALVEAWTTASGFERIASVPIADTMLFSWSYTTRDRAWMQAAADDLDALLDIGARFMGAEKEGAR